MNDNANHTLKVLGKGPTSRYSPACRLRRFLLGPLASGALLFLGASLGAPSCFRRMAGD